MNCQQIRKLILAGETPTADAMEHIRSCAFCTVLTQGDPIFPMSSHQETLQTSEQQIQDRIQQHSGLRAWLQSRPNPMRSVLLFLFMTLLFALIFLVSPRSDLLVYPKERLLLEILAACSLLIALVRAAFRPLFQAPLSTAYTITLVCSVLVVVVLLSMLPQAHQLQPASLQGVGEEFIPAAMRCLASGMLFSLPIVLLWLLLSRGKNAWEQQIFMGLTSLLAGYLALFLHCPITAPTHLLLGHAGMVLLGALIMLAFLRWKLARSATG